MMQQLRVHLLITLAAVVWIAPCMVAAAADTPSDYHVAPDGDDAHPGTRDQPFATIERARDAVRHAKADDPNRDLTVWLHEGVYRLDRTVLFDLRDSAAADRTITYAAWQDARPIITSAAPITSWRKPTDPSTALPDAARPHVWVADIPASIGRFHTLYDAAGRLPRARSDGVKPTRPFPSPRLADAQRHEALYTLHYPPGLIRDWPNLHDIEIVIIPMHRWVMNILQLGKVDEARHIARTTVAGTYPLLATINFDKSLWVENAIDYLDEPGEWVLDTTRHRLYLWPRDGQPPRYVAAPRLGQLFMVRGAVDRPGPRDVPVRGLVFRGLHFTGADRIPWHNHERGIQHDWIMLDKPDALLRFNAAEHCVVDACEFSESGQHAIRFDGHAQHNRVINNEIRTLGGGGILFLGYGPGTKDVNHTNHIISNHIHHIGQIRWDAHGIVLWQSGRNRVAHNFIHHVPRKAICITGARLYSYRPDRQQRRECGRSIRWHEVVHPPATWRDAIPYTHSRDNRVEHNHVTHALMRLADGSAINVSGAGPGNVIRHNLLSHINNIQTSGILRADNYQFGTVFEHNILLNSEVGGITLKGSNVIRNNVMIDVARVKADFIHTSPGWGPFDEAVITHNIFYHRGGDQHFYYQIRPGRTDAFDRAEIDRNIYYNAQVDDTAANALLQELRRKGHDRHSHYGPPGFVDWRNGDFNFTADAPARKLGIKPISLEGIGLRDDFPQRFRRYLGDDQP